MEIYPYIEPWHVLPVLVIWQAFHEVKNDLIIIYVVFGPLAEIDGGTRNGP